MKKGKMKRQWKRNIWQPWIESNAFYPVFTPQSQTLFLFLPCLVLASTMRRGAKRKTKQGQEAKHDAPEDNKPKAQPRAKRAKTSKPQSEPEYFEDKRNLVSLINTSPSPFNFLISIRTVFFNCMRRTSNVVKNRIERHRFV